MTECIFCKIINQEIPSYKVYEDESVYAFLDISQATPGHTLVIPKKHVSDIFAYTDSLASEVFASVPKIARALELAFPTMAGLNIVNNNKALAYQTVFHSHFHLVPRYTENDSFEMRFGENQGSVSASKMQEIADKINEQVKING